MHPRFFSNRNPLFGFLALSAAAACLPGCSAFVVQAQLTPQDKAISEVRHATLLYTIAVTTFNDLVSSARIDRGQAAEIEEIRQRVWDHLSAARFAAESGTPIDAQTQLRLFTDDLSAMNELLLRAIAPDTPSPGHPEG